MALPATGWRGATDEKPSTRAARSTRLVAGHTGRAAWRFTANRQCHRNRQVRSESAAGVSPGPFVQATDRRSEEHTSELQSLMRISYAVFCLNKKKNQSASIEAQP